MPDLGGINQEIARGAGVPNDATSFTAFNATAVAAEATPQSIRAAVTGKKKWIASLIAVNLTTTEDAVLKIQDSDDTNYALIVPGDVDQVTGAQPAQYFFNPPIEIPAGLGIQVDCIGDIGDSHVTVTGWEQA